MKNQVTSSCGVLIECDSWCGEFDTVITLQDVCNNSSRKGERMVVCMEYPDVSKLIKNLKQAQKETRKIWRELQAINDRDRERLQKEDLEDYENTRF